MNKKHIKQLSKEMLRELSVAKNDKEKMMIFKKYEVELKRF